MINFKWERVIFEYSYGWIFPMLIGALVIARFKYKKLIRLPDLSPFVAFFISALRFLVVFLLFFLLLNPALSLLKQEKVKPLLILAQDNSASLLNNKDSLYYRKAYKEFLDKEIEHLREKFEVEFLSFGKNVTKGETVSFSEHYTDIASVFDYVEENYSLRRPQALLLLSDGVYNTGLNPRYKTTTYPVYTVALGDTTEMPDVYIKSVEYDKFNFIHTLFPIKADVAAVGQKGQKLKCTLLENGKVIEEKAVFIDKEHFLQELVFQVKAEKKGIARYRLAIEGEFEERTKENNNAWVYINILDNSGEVTLYYKAPHPDIAALTEAIRSSGIYRCSVYDFSRFSEEQKSDLMILYNPQPEDPYYRKIQEMAERKKIPIWYILTDRSGIEQFARFGKEYATDFPSDKSEYATLQFNRDFPFFEFTEQEILGFSHFPPLTVPFGEIKAKTGKVLFFQNIKNIPTTHPILSFYTGPHFRSAFFLGEGFWRWRLFSYKENGNHELFNTLVYKITGYLMTKRGEERFIHDIRPLYDEKEETILNVELYNDSYELVNTPEVKLSLRHDEKDFNYNLNRYNDKYRLNLGNLPAGTYDYQLSAYLKGESFEKKGTFYVRTENQELNDGVANHQLLRELAIQSGGRIMGLNDLGEWVRSMNKNPEFKSGIHREIRLVELNDLKGIGIFLILLLCIEWFLLKYFVGF